MAGQNVVTFKGTLQAGPPKSSSSSFPTGIVNASFELTPAAKAAPVSVQQVRNMASPAAYVALDVGPNQSVTQANFVYCRTEAPFSLRVTFDDGAGGSVVSVIPVSGIFAIEAPDGQYIKLLEAQGTGVFEYFASGNR